MSKTNITKVSVDWHVFKGISLSESAYEAGVTIAFLDQLEKRSEITFREVRNSIVSSILKRLGGEWQERFNKEEDDEYKTENAFYNIKNGVYVIRAGEGFELDYQRARSPVMYIGKGKVRSRLQTHLRGKLFEFWRSLGTVPLDFYICSLNECTSWKGEHADSALESLLIKEFDPAGTGADFSPLLNKNTPRISAANFLFTSNWKLAVQRRGQTKTTDWILRPADPGKWEGSLT